jgi:Icc-related predicted phosphoesterase
MNETKYGIISDVHEKIGLVKVAIENFKSQGVTKLILNGDISSINAQSQDEAQKYFAHILGTAAQSGLETFVQPGSHETIDVYEPVLNFFASRYNNIIDTKLNPKIEFDSHHLIFIPGSDVNGIGEYSFGNNPNLPTSKYVRTKEELIQIDDYGEFVAMLQNGQIPNIEGIMEYKNINDVRNLVTDPDKTIVICHVPRNFNGVSNGVDVAHFIESYSLDMRLASYISNPKLKEKFIHATKIVPAETSVGQKLLSRQDSMKIKNGNFSEDEIISFGMRYSLMNAQPVIEFNVEKFENRGNNELKTLYQELGITKAVNGHFHEASHNAHDSKGIFIPQNTLVNELYWNSGHMDNRHTGILTIKDNAVSYQNLDFN